MVYKIYTYSKVSVCCILLYYYIFFLKFPWQQNTKTMLKLRNIKPARILHQTRVCFYEIVMGYFLINTCIIIYFEYKVQHQIIQIIRVCYKYCCGAAIWYFVQQRAVSSTPSSMCTANFFPHPVGGTSLSCCSTSPYFFLFLYRHTFHHVFCFVSWHHTVHFLRSVCSRPGRNRPGRWEWFRVDPGAPGRPSRPGRGGEDSPGQIGRRADGAVGTEGE